ncbi:MAG: N-acetylmuramoyl-L-alanine amidase family protein [Ruminococcaceae bacterium]|nr:N-acetylmuramoyl-L-alanine amidase family protein [Oscillospiraceae bacterium]
MKKMRKLRIASLILTLAMVLSMLPLSAVPANAEVGPRPEDVDSITITNVEPMIEKDLRYGYMKRDYIGGDEKGNGEDRTPEYFYYEYFDELKKIITIKFKEETGYADEVLTGTDDYSEKLDLYIYFQENSPQNFENQWTVGNEYSVYAWLEGYHGEIDVCFMVKIVESPVELMTVELEVGILEYDTRYGFEYEDGYGNTKFYYIKEALPLTITVYYKASTGWGPEVLIEEEGGLKGGGGIRRYYSERLDAYVYLEDPLAPSPKGKGEISETNWPTGFARCLRAEIAGKHAFFDVLVIKGTGWQEVSGRWYYFNSDETILKNKWKSDSKGWCYLGYDGAMAKHQWVRDSKGWCYVGADGRCLTNKWFKHVAGWSYFDREGRMVTNKWVADSKGWCYLDADGIMVTNKWVRDTVTWCYVGADGRAVKNQWQKDSNGWCYLDENARLTIGWKQISGKKYYFNRNGTMVTGRQVIDGKVYRFDANGALIG